jgi:hypothetical protein
VWSRSGASNNRMLGCYMDFSTLVVDDPKNFMYADGYFLLGAGWLNTEQSFISLRPSVAEKGINGLRITGNQIEVSGAKPHWLTINHTALAKTGMALPSFSHNASKSYDNIVTGNVVALAGTVTSMVGTHVTQSLTQASATEWRFNLSTSLLFGSIQGNVQFSFAPEATSSTHPPPATWLASDGREDGLVVVRSAAPASGRVYIDVEQSAFVGGVMRRKTDDTPSPLSSQPRFHAPVVVKINNSTGGQGGGEQAVYPCMFIGLNSTFIFGNIGSEVSGIPAMSAFSANGGKSWNELPASAVAAHSGDWIRDSTGLWHNFGDANRVPAPKPAMFSNFSSNFTDVIRQEPGIPHIEQNIHRGASFSGLPNPVACGNKTNNPRHYYGWPTCAWWTGSGGSVRLPDGKFLQTTVVLWLLGEEGSTLASAGVFAFKSADSYVWNYSGTVAAAANFPESGEGPNENAISLTSRGDVLCVMRMDGSPIATNKNYYVSRSAAASQGAQWSAAVPIPNASWRYWTTAAFWRSFLQSRA